VAPFTAAALGSAKGLEAALVELARRSAVPGFQQRCQQPSALANSGTSGHAMLQREVVTAMQCLAAAPAAAGPGRADGLAAGGKGPARSWFRKRPFQGWQGGSQ